MVALTDHFIFELDQPLKLQSKINNVPDSTQQYFKLTTLRCLQNVSDFNDIEPVYQEFCYDIEFKLNHPLNSYYSFSLITHFVDAYTSLDFEHSGQCTIGLFPFSSEE